MTSDICAFLRNPPSTRRDKDDFEIRSLDDLVAKLLAACQALVIEADYYADLTPSTIMAIVDDQLSPLIAAIDSNTNG